MEHNLEANAQTGLVFGSIEEREARQLENSSSQSQGFGMYWSPSPPPGAPRLGNGATPESPPQAPRRSSVPISPTLGQLNLPNDIYAPARDPSHPPYPYAQHVAPSHWPAQAQPLAPPAPAYAAIQHPVYPQLPENAYHLPNHLAPEALPVISPYRMTHGPLQAERLEMRDAQALEKARREDDKATEKERREQKKREDRERKEKEKEEERVRKEVNRQQKEDERAARERKKQEDRAARERKAEEKAEEKARKDRKKVEEKERKDREKAEKAAAAEKKKAKSSKSAADDAAGRAAGDSDTEIKAAGAGATGGDIKPIAMQPATKHWSEDETLKVVKHILSVWGSFKLKQTATFTYISKYILLGSKSQVQVGNQWNTLWKKFKASVRREKHTGGGDGDELEEDANRPEPENDSDIEMVDNEPKGEEGNKEEENKEVAKKKEKISGFTESQLIAFEQTEAYKLILAVVGSDPEVSKAEEFDSSRPLSDSDDADGATKPSPGKSSDTIDGDIIKDTFKEVRAIADGLAESRKATVELAERREQREIVAAKEEKKYRDRRFELDERRLRIDEENHRESQWEKVESYLKSGDEMLIGRGKRLAARLERQEREEET